MNGPRDSSASSSEPTDEELLASAAAGDGSALDQLYGRYKSMAFALASRITGDGALAEDVLQEAFLGIWRNASRFVAPRASGRTWILSIVHHRAIDAVRRRRPTSELPETDVPPPSLVLPDAWAEVAGHLDRQAIQAALASISAVQREAIELAYFGGLTQREIAERTGAPLGTVKSRVRLGLLGLRATLTDASVDPPPGGAEIVPGATPGGAPKARP